MAQVRGEGLPIQVISRNTREIPTPRFGTIQLERIVVSIGSRKGSLFGHPGMTELQLLGTAREVHGNIKVLTSDLALQYALRRSTTPLRSAVAEAHELAGDLTGGGLPVKRRPLVEQMALATMYSDAGRKSRS